MFDGNIVEVDGSYDGIPGRFIIDTGARNSLSLNTPFVEKNRLHVAKGEEATTGWGVGGPTKSFVMHGGKLRIGGVDVPGPLVLLSTDKGGFDAAAELAGNIGGGILKRFAVTFDYERNTMYLKPVAGAVADLDTFDRSGVWINRDQRRLQDRGCERQDTGGRRGACKGRHRHRGRRQGRDRHRASRPAPRLRNEAPGTVVTFAVKGKGEVKLTLRDLI